MCSIGEDDFGDEGGVHAMTKEELIANPHIMGICNKCSAEGMVIKLKFREPECKDCFLAYARHKFRATLGSSKILPKGAEVLLVFDGSAASIVLLDMMHYAQSQNSFKRLHCNTKLLYIDENAVKETETYENVERVAKFLEKYQLFDKFIVSVAKKDSLTQFTNLDEYFRRLKTNIENDLSYAIANIKSLTSRQDFMKRYKNTLIQSAAEKLDCGYIFMSDISTNLAAELLTSICLGRGGSAALDVSLLDTRLPNLQIIRPIKDLNEMEVKFYMQVNELTQLNFYGYGEDAVASASIQNLTKHFVNNLQQNFSSTVSTIFRTGDKIAPKCSIDRLSDKIADLELDGNSTTTTTTCSFCNSNLDYLGSKTLLAIEFSRLVSEGGTTIDQCKDLEINARRNLHDVDGKTKYLCHGCRNIHKDSLNKLNFI